MSLRNLPLRLSNLLVGAISDGNYTEFEADGTRVAKGDATTWKDELGPLTGRRLESPSSRIVYNLPEGSVTFKSNATLADYVIINLQINHDWEIGTNIDFHIHWWQNQAAIPNWLIGYRWQVNGQAKTTAWTNYRWTTNIFTYVSGTLNQITDFTIITPPGGAGISDILQIRLYRDTANDSTLFTGVDPVATDVDGISSDAHKKINTDGSRQEYTK